MFRSLCPAVRKGRRFMLALSLTVAVPGCMNDFDALSLPEAENSSAGGTSVGSGAQTNGASVGGFASASGGARAGGGGSAGDGGAGDGGTVGTAGSSPEGGRGGGLGTGGAGVECDQQYPGYVHCTDDANQCEIITPNSQPCSTWCGMHGGTCLGAWDNYPAGSCDLASAQGCDTTGFIDLVCTCSHD